MVLLPRRCIATPAVWALPRSLATTGGIIVYFLFLEVLRCFSSLGSPPTPQAGMTVLQTAGLSHSEIRGSMVICTYPRLIAACHVLHRLREPRHPPCALRYFRHNEGLIRNMHGYAKGNAKKNIFTDSPTSIILSAVDSFSNLQSCLCQHVKDL